MSKRCRRRFLQVARSHFDSLIAQVAQRVQGKLPHVDRRAHQELSQKLTTSLVDGETVLFEDPGALGDYTLRRLRPRCRALLEVLLAQNCTELVESLLKRLELCRKEEREFRVASLGGGPGFDAIAMLAAMAALKEASQQEPSANLWSERFLTEDCRDCAVRFGLSSSLGNRNLSCFRYLRDSMATSAVEEVGQADLVIAAYVLHENEAALLVEGLLGGVIPDVFRAAPVGVPLIFLDATHRLWPALVETARASCSSSLSEGNPRHVDAMPFTVIVPEGLGSHIHAVILIKDETPSLETLSDLSAFELFKSHQKANEMRLKRLSELQKAANQKTKYPSEDFEHEPWRDTGGSGFAIPFGRGCRTCFKRQQGAPSMM
eukprot:s276_g19.t1